MKTTKKQLNEIKEIEKKVAKVCDTKKTTEVTRNDEGVIINKETGKPHFPELLEKKSTDIAIALGFGRSAPKIKQQLKTQGFKTFQGIIIDAELIRTDLHGLHRIGILKEKELWKCFNRLSKKICKVIVDSEPKDGEIAVHKETIIG
jgi:hypothetical protein